MEPQNNQSVRDQILEILHLQKFIKRNQLRQQLTGRGYYISDRDMRLEIEALIISDGYAIASGNNGYSLITDEKELNKTLEYLDKKERGIKDRRIALVKNFHGQKDKLFQAGEQAEFSFI